MKMSRDELARRFAEADRMVVLLRRATLDMALIEREVAALAVEIPDWDVRARWAEIRSRRGG